MYETKQDVIDAVEKFTEVTGISGKVIVIGGGGALVLRGLRDKTADLNLWVHEAEFKALGEKHGIVLHPLRDTVISVPDANAWVRKYNPYFESEVLQDQRFETLKVLPLLIQKRGSYNEPPRPKAKRVQDHKDIVALNDILREANKVKDFV